MTSLPFTGSIDFKLAIGVLDVGVLRKARLTYAYMPAWSYYDVRSGTERSGEFQLEAGLSILAYRNRTGAEPRMYQRSGIGHRSGSC
jgi:hypothetical protein